MSDSWDDDESTKTSSGFGGGFGRGGFGRGRGFVNKGESGGFGGGSRGGFGSGATQNGGFGSGGGFGRNQDGGDAADDDSGARRGGFGAKRGGFGSRGGFGRSNEVNGTANGDGGFGDSDSRPSRGGGGFGGRGRGGFGKTGGFGRSNDDGESNEWSSGGDKPSGGFGASRGGFGAKRGGGFGARSSGGFGNSSGDGDDGDSKPSGGFGSGRGGGFGSRGGGFGGGFGRKSDGDDAPRGGGFGRGSDDSGGRKGGCYKCGEDGHMARECPNSESGGGRSGGGGGGGCYKCGEDGHFARECPSSQSSGGGGGRGCHKCGEEGHFARECPNSESSGGGGGGGGGCYKCGESGHFARECPNAEGGGGGGGDGEEKKREIYVPPPPPEDEEEIFRTLQKGINFDKYDEIPVECTGDDAPKRGIQSFEEADLMPTFLENVRKARYEKPTPIQKWAIPIISHGRDLMACAQTGSGKTAAFLLPVLTGMLKNNYIEGGEYLEVQKPAALVIGPTRELVTQIFNEARKFAYGTITRPVVVYGGTSVGYQLREVEKGAHMVVGTPGRLLDFIGRGKISLENVKYLILDEADRMLDMGFEGDVRKMVDTMGMPGKSERQTLMFSATFPEEIQRLARDFLNNYLFVTVGRVGGANTDIDQHVYEVTQFEKRDKLVSILNEMGQDRTLVFVEQKRNADFLASYLSQSSFPTTSIHGDRLQREREEALRDFKSGKAPILVATSVAARGLDIPNVMHVVNYDLPSSIEEYVHRIGRTARCGNTGKATSFFDTSNDGGLARSLVKILQDAQQEVPRFLEEAAEQSFGQGFSGAGGRFGGKDARRGKFGGGGDRNDGGFGNDSGGGGFSAGNDGGDDEDWD